MKIAGYLKTSLIDYPGTVASVVYTSACNFSCEFCHNKDLIEDTQTAVDHEMVFNHLDKRVNILDGVVVTGGEPTLQKNLIPFIKTIKAKGFKVKLDTNGYKPEILKELLSHNLVDYVAMDIKNTSDKYAVTISKDIMSIEAIKKSVQLLQESGIDYEFRTTWIKEFHHENDVHGIGEMIMGSKRYVLQQYQYSDKQIKDQHYNYFTLEEMGRLKDEIAVHYDIEEVIVRGRY